MNAQLYIYPALALLLSAFINNFLIRYLRKKNLLDVPNERSSHKIPTPRGGGIGILFGVMIAALIYCLQEGDHKMSILLGCSAVIGVTGWIDDVRKGLPSGLRFLIQTGMAAIVMIAFQGITLLPFPAPLDIHLGYFAYLFAIIWLVGITNIFNFLDGIDGYAGTQGLIAGVGIAIMAWGTPVGIVGLIAAAACLGFLFFNWHPAKIFMGDVGSSFLGFLFAALPFYIPDEAPRTELFFVAGILLWFFLTDGSFTMIRRVLKGEKIWVAHRSHLYQRLVIAGMSHSQVVLLVAGMYVLLTGLLFYMVFAQHVVISWPVLVLGAVLFGVYLLFTMRKENRK